MKILQIVTLVSPDGAYGGPVRVATNQVKQLRNQNHDVILIAGSKGFDANSLPKKFDGAPVILFNTINLFPRLGFATLCSPQLILWLFRNVTKFDVVHIHLGRDLITIPAGLIALARRKKFILQTHGMIDRSTKKLAKIIDIVGTIPLMRAAKSVLFLTPEEADSLTYVAGEKLKKQFLPNGIPVISEAPRQPEAIKNILYLARLQSRKRPEFFVKMALALHEKYPQNRYVIAGPDEGSAAEVKRLIADGDAESYVRWIGAVPPAETQEMMLKADLYVLPSVNEPFPMSVLEAMSVGTPPVVSRSCGLAPYISQCGGGGVFDDSLSGLIRTVDEIIKSPNNLHTMSKSAQEMIQNEFSIEHVCSQLEKIYGEVLKANS